ncbi:MAG: hypothetical protein IKT71_01045 [Paludibacteraceae bacterium]|nr:hypothetical protein [Paludibacteraceae bacterium]
MKKEKEIKLPPIWLCILLDVAGCISYFLPTWGEWIDAIWAPLSALFFYLLFGGKTGALGAVINFVEESLPFADILPMFTIGYFVRKREIKKLNTENKKLKE